MNELSSNALHLETLARAAVDCPKWRWMSGMKVAVPAAHEGDTGYFLRLSQDGYVPAAHEYPDFTDPATLGCLLALVREAWEAPTISTRYSEYVDRGGEWDVPIPTVDNRVLDIIFFKGKSEAEALIVALQASKLVP